MVRETIYLIGEKVVSKEEWEDKLNDETNLETLSIQYENIDIKDVIEENKKLREENKRLKVELELEKRMNQIPKNPWDTGEPYPWTTPNTGDRYPWGGPIVTYCTTLS